MIEIKLNEIRRWRKTVRDAFTKYSVPATDTAFVIIEAKIVDTWSHKFSKSIPVQYYVVRYMPSGTVREYSEDVIRSHTRPAK